MKRLKVGFAAFAALVYALAGASTALAQTPKRGGTLTVLFGTEPTALVTIASTAYSTYVIHTKIFESLLEYSGPELTPKPGIAEAWSSTDDQTAWTFKLRPDVKFHDGQPMTSADVKFSIEKVVIPYHSRGKINFQQLESIETPDARTVVFKLKRAQPYFLKIFQAGETPILPKHILESPAYADLSKIRTSGFMQKPIGTGPFKLTEQVKGSHLILERHAEYWRKDRPYLDRIIFRILTDDSARVIAMEKGDVDVAVYSVLPESDIDRLVKLPHIRHSTDGLEGLGLVVNANFNLRDKYMGDQKVRQAISYAIDRKTIANVIFYGFAKPTTSPIFIGNPFFNKKLPPYEHSIRKANELLDQAGYKRGANGIRFSMTIDYIPYGATWARMADYAKAQLRRIGIDANIRAVDLGTWLKLIYTDWDFQMTFNLASTYVDPAIGTGRYYMSTSIRKGAAFTNAAGYQNPTLDELFDRGALEMNPEQRRALYDKAQEIIYQDLPIMQLVTLPTVTVWHKRVHNLISNGISVYTGYADVWVE